MQFGNICNFSHFLNKIWGIHLRSHQTAAADVGWVNWWSQFTHLHHRCVIPALGCAVNSEFPITDQPWKLWGTHTAWMSCVSHSRLCRNRPELPLLPLLRSDSPPSCFLWELRPQPLPQLHARGDHGGVDCGQQRRLLHWPGLRSAQLLPGCKRLPGVGHGGFRNLLSLEALVTVEHPKTFAV